MLNIYLKYFEPLRASPSLRRWLVFGLCYDASLFLLLYSARPFERLPPGLQLWVPYAIVVAVAWFSHVALLGLTFGIYRFRFAEVWRLLYFGLLCMVSLMLIPVFGVIYYMSYAIFYPLIASTQSILALYALIYVVFALVGSTIGFMAYSLKSVMNVRLGRDAEVNDGGMRADVLGGALCALLLFAAPMFVGQFIGLGGFSALFHAFSIYSSATPLWVLASFGSLSLLPHLFLTGLGRFGASA